MKNKIEHINQAIKHYYAQNKVSKDLVEAILYSVDAGGKRIRPLLLLEMLQGFGLMLTEAHYQVAAGLEMIHTGSLIHDDLPAMDDDDYRRGQLTNHKKFDEATAILAGDSLFLDPFTLLANADLAADIKVRLIAELSAASGSYGMVAGQMLDIKGEKSLLSLTDIAKIHANKTGRLLTFPFVAAGIIAELSDLSLAKLRQAGALVGLAFQVRDDILDVTASFAELGKTPQKDQKTFKSTYPSLLGLNESYAVLEDSLDQAQSIFQKLSTEEEFDKTKIDKMLERLRLHA
ncbi:polyprenyl synthetase family protein [Streptococcus macacae]|uniref:Farnesyl diphosphate synthase n=1 Tax=Streptococcus macacae NCTC 11558 TaxID=764298 RepID=G5JVX1_9STRE|nr:farnesyl diphosphate synthase [Streptococcus macacae]EHJ53313.1 polyprenyl synthetase [Streptococcus macacae NCTC 11558]SUN78962.1 farnesyl diphosphate synthase [Streptococcus macacae NCTC 11558]